MKRIKKIIVICMIVIISFAHSIDVGAAEMNFSVKPNIPENQVDRDVGYFHLKMKPGESQTISVTMKNDTNREVIVESYANTAITNDNGVIDYSKSDPELDETLKIPFSEIATIQKETKIPPKSSKDVNIKIEMPEELYNGIVLGGLHFMEKEDPSEKHKKDDDIQIKNRYAYVIGVVLEETDIKIKPELKLNEIKPTQVNYRNVLAANIQNTKPTMVSNLDIKASVYKENGKNVLYSDNSKDLRMAPNSNFNYAISWATDEFKPGKYRLEMIATDGDQFWKWNEKFEIEGEVAKELNKKSVNVKKNYKWLFTILGIIILVLLLRMSYKLGQKSNQKEKDNQAKNSHILR